jgi:hypothetical protein
LKSTTAIFSVPKDRLGCRRTRESSGAGGRRSPAGCTAQSAPGVCSPAAGKVSMFARWPYLHRSDPLPSAGAGSAGRIAGRRGHSRRPPGRAPGPVLGLNPPRPVWSYALSGSCNLGHFFSWTRMVPSTAMMWCIVFRSVAATGGPHACSNSTWPLPPGRRLGLGLPLGPSRSFQRTCGRAPGTDPRAAGPCAGMAMTASGCILRPRPAGVKIFHGRLRIVRGSVCAAQCGHLMACTGQCGGHGARASVVILLP